MEISSSLNEIKELLEEIKSRSKNNNRSLVELNGNLSEFNSKVSRGDGDEEVLGHIYERLEGIEKKLTVRDEDNGELKSERDELVKEISELKEQKTEMKYKVKKYGARLELLKKEFGVLEGKKENLMNWLEIEKDRQTERIRRIVRESREFEMEERMVKVISEGKENEKVKIVKGRNFTSS